MKSYTPELWILEKINQDYICLLTQMKYFTFPLMVDKTALEILDY